MEMRHVQTTDTIPINNPTVNSDNSLRATHLDVSEDPTKVMGRSYDSKTLQARNVNGRPDVENAISVTSPSGERSAESPDAGPSLDRNSSVLESVDTVHGEENARPPPGKRVVRITLYVVGSVLFLAYLGYAVALNSKRAVPLVVLTSLVLVAVLWRLARSRCKVRQLLPQHNGPEVQNMHGDGGGTRSPGGAEKSQYEICKKATKVSRRFWNLFGQRKVKIGCYILTISATCGFLVSQHHSRLDRLRPVSGLAAIVLVSVLLSYDRSKINWRPVVWGMALQVALAVLTLRTRPGREWFRYLGQQMEHFLEHVLAGVLFVFGDKYTDFFFIFKLMPTVIFLSSVISVLYHVGVMQRLVGLIAAAMSVTMTTTAAESTGIAACIFLGQPEASLTIRPFLERMTRSELFAITTAGFASVTADVFAIFVHYGMPSSHIITAVLMSAPASIAVAKIICPETEVSHTKDRKELHACEKRMVRQRSALDAAVQGAQDAVSIVAAVVATIIAFLSILSFFNSVIAYLGGLVDVEGLSLETLVAYPLMPVAYTLGVAWEDCRPVAEVIGLKTFVNELVGYQRLKQLVQEGAIKQRRSQVIAMYALCGFSNPTTVGVTLGGLGAMVPQKRQVLVNIILMAWLAGSLSCFMTAAWAGLLYTETEASPFLNITE